MPSPISNGMMIHDAAHPHLGAFSSEMALSLSFTQHNFIHRLIKD